MKTTTGWLLLGLATWLAGATCWGQGSAFYRVGCPDGVAPENLEITLDESGQVLLQFDTVDQHTYVIEATDALLSAAWKGLSWFTGDGLRAAYVTTLRWSRTFGGTESDPGYSVQETSDRGLYCGGQYPGFANCPAAVGPACKRMISSRGSMRPRSPLCRSLRPPTAPSEEDQLKSALYAARNYRA